MNIDRVRKIFEFLSLHNDKIDCDYFEFEWNLRLIEKKLNAIKETIDKQTPHQVLFTYHLDRFFSYCTALLDLLIQAQVTNRLGRYFKSSRLSGGLDKLTHSMQYELNLFCDYIDELYRGILKNDGKNREAFASLTVQLVHDSQGQALWRERFGIDVRKTTLSSIICSSYWYDLVAIRRALDLILERLWNHRWCARWNHETESEERFRYVLLMTFND